MRIVLCLLFLVILPNELRAQLICTKKPISQSASFFTHKICPLLLQKHSLGAVGNSAGQPRPGYLNRETRSALVPGLQVTFSTKKEGQQSQDTRVDRLAALYIPAGKAPTPLLPRGPFHATWTGYIKNRLRDEFLFHLKGQGQATLYLNQKEVLKAGPGDLSEAKPVRVELAKGYNHVRLEYDNPDSGEAWMRLYWSGEKFPLEPVQVNAFLCDGRNKDLQTGLLFREGRELFAQMHCVKCHSVGDVKLMPEEAMPELFRDAPSLAGVGGRLNPHWVAHWIFDPESVRNKTTMPKLLLSKDTAQVQKTAADLAAYLATLGKSDKVGSGPKAEDKEKLIEQGVRLYEFRGCIACHRFTAPSEADMYDRVSLHYVGEKFRPGALAHFLMDTHAHYQWIRMPLFRFSKEEGIALETFLRKEAKGKLKDFPNGDVDKGRLAFKSLGCSNCHAADEYGLQKSLAAGNPFQTPLSKGCLAQNVNARGKAPAFGFDEKQLQALTAFLKQGPDSLTTFIPAEFAQRQFHNLNCVACHERDDTISKLVNVIGDEGYTGLLPDPIPQLTWVGEKLHPDWSEQLLAGKLDYRLRSHFKTHMPAFPAQAKWLAIGLSHQHGFTPTKKTVVPFDKEAAQVGERIAITNAGFACNRCHAIGNKPATAPEQALSTNLSYAYQRLRYEYYTRWMLNPMRVDPRTAMIQFAPDSQTTPLKEFYKGDARQQFDAVWHYLRVLDEKKRKDREKQE